MIIFIYFDGYKKYILFDVADTLIYKKNLILSIYDILTNNNMIVSIDELKHTHRKTP